MPTVHVFVSTGKFESFDAMRAYIDESYDEDDEVVDSPFIKETKLTDYEPMCIEAIHETSSMPIRKLLDGASFGEQWINKLDPGIEASEAICVFEPNKLKTPSKSSLRYCGEFEYSTKPTSRPR